ncbi:probable GH family 25 lysozyme 3 [Anopheles marshallii]|uniref:probable GH family 25 lysozyme 3 n=1 Tax=Anopheles marshallii TaxID=1521116 RepID=UPI00237A656E|nr:probable GH family 25 lysozyme 3 [Anopheles marshallii]
MDDFFVSGGNGTGGTSTTTGTISNGTLGGLLTGGNGNGGGGSNGGSTNDGNASAVGSNFTRIRSTTRSTMAKATAVRVSTGKKFSQLLIITPAVAIDSNEHDDYHGPFNSSSLDSGCGGSSEGSLSDDLLDEDEQRRQRRRHAGPGDRRNNNGTTQQLPPLLGGSRDRRDGGGSSSQQGTWRWCGLICSAVKCFRAAAATTGSRRSQQGPSSRQPLAGTAVRYTTSEGAWGEDRTGRRQASSRFSNNHVYEYTIKSYHHPQRERRSNGGTVSVTLPSTVGSRSASISSDSSALSVLAEAVTLADHDHINNNSAVNNNGNILTNSSAGGTAAGTTSLVVATTSSGDSSPTIETSAIGGRVNERHNIMYKL